MSMFLPTTVNCPECRTPVDFMAVVSVNADRRADLRDAIIDGSFQRQPCTKCGKAFRLDPELTYVNSGRGQWIAAFPVAKLGQWRELEEQSRATFAQAYGPQAPAVVRKMAAAIKPRITFGWGGLREKLVIPEHSLDDVTLELAKLAIVRASKSSPLSNAELRFIAVEGDKLVMAWIRPQSEQVVEMLKVPRKLHDDIAKDKEWEPLRKEISVGLFVDMNRLMVGPG